MCNNAIPVNWLFWKKRILDSLVCVLCNLGIESVEHLLLKCEWTRGYGLNAVMGGELEKRMWQILMYR